MLSACQLSEESGSSGDFRVPEQVQDVPMSNRIPSRDGKEDQSGQDEFLFKAGPA